VEAYREAKGGGAPDSLDLSRLEEAVWDLSACIRWILNEKSWRRE
jgi:hypothetical protein